MNECISNTLLGLLERAREEDERVAIVDGLALLGASEAAGQLMSDYAAEDEDTRFFILKALDYFGGEARAFAVESGLRDEEYSCRRLAERIR